MRTTHSGLGVLLGATVLLGACAKKKEAAAPVGTDAVARRTIVVDAQATGAVEPINVIEVKSKASGQIVRIPVETGTQVNAGDLLVQVDTRDVKNQFDQAAADLRSAQAALEVAQSNKKRSDELYKTRIITAQEYESAQLALTQAQGAIVRATTNVDLAKQRLEDATVVAPVNGTIIDKPVSLGQVIASATGSVTGGTTLLKMADLKKVRMRALVNETDIGSVRAGQSARVTVDAYPDRPFQGVVEKIEPQAVIQQSVTMFPVIISLDNNEGYLKPGMNGEVSMLVDRRENVVAVTNDAVRTLREAATAAQVVGLNPDSVVAMVREQQANMRNGGGGAGGAGDAGKAGDASAAQKVAVGEGAGGGEKKAGRAEAGNAEAGKAGTTRGAGKAERAPRGDGSAMGTPPSTPIRPRTALVFVQDQAGKFAPRIVRLGASNYDYSEVLSGLKEGDKVATLNVGMLQQKRDQQNDRFRSMTGSGVPGMGAPAGGGAGAGGARGAGGGGNGGGGGGARPQGGGGR
jgi:HlyD family secretion protein